MLMPQCTMQSNLSWRGDVWLMSTLSSARDHNASLKASFQLQISALIQLVSFEDTLIMGPRRADGVVNNPRLHWAVETVSEFISPCLLFVCASVFGLFGLLVGIQKRMREEMEKEVISECLWVWKKRYYVCVSRGQRQKETENINIMYKLSNKILTFSNSKNVNCPSLLTINYIIYGRSLRDINHLFLTHCFEAHRQQRPHWKCWNQPSLRRVHT